MTTLTLQWIEAHAPALQVAVGALTLLVWLGYFQLLLTSLRHQRRPCLLINTGAGRGIRQRCFVSNLGMEPVYLMDLVIRVEAAGRTEVAAITDPDPDSDDTPRDAANATNQGPLDSGAMRDLGTFETLIARAVREVGGLAVEDVQRLDLVAVYAVAAQARIGAAKRGFRIEAGEDGAAARLLPDSVRVRQVRGWWRRRQLRRWLEARRQGRPRAGGLP